MELLKCAQRDVKFTGEVGIQCQFIVDHDLHTISSLKKVGALQGTVSFIKFPFHLPAERLLQEQNVCIGFSLKKKSFVGYPRLQIISCLQETVG